MQSFWSRNLFRTGAFLAVWQANNVCTQKEWLICWNDEAALHHCTQIWSRVLWNLCSTQKWRGCLRAKTCSVIPSLQDCYITVTSWTIGKLCFSQSTISKHRQEDGNSDFKEIKKNESFSGLLETIQHDSSLTQLMPVWGTSQRCSFHFHEGQPPCLICAKKLNISFKNVEAAWLNPGWSNMAPPQSVDLASHADRHKRNGMVTFRFVNTIHPAITYLPKFYSGYLVSAELFSEWICFSILWSTNTNVTVYRWLGRKEETRIKPGCKCGLLFSNGVLWLASRCFSRRTQLLAFDVIRY